MADPVSRAYARSLAERRKAQQLTIGQLAVKSGVSRATICEMEAGRKGCSLRVAHALATALRATVDAMIRDGKAVDRAAA